MATFSFRARDAAHRRETGVINAETARHARERLRERGLRVESIAERRIHHELLARWMPRRQRYRGKLTIAIREMATLLQAGIPLLTVLDALVSQFHGGFADCMLAVRDQVAAGSTLAAAMEREPKVFDEMTVALVRIGEHAGNLDEVCEQIAVYRERSGELADRVLSAVLYPAIVLLVSLGVTLFLMTAVVPMLLNNLDEMGQALPWPTRFLKFLSDSLLEYGIWIGWISLVILFLVIRLARTTTGRYALARGLLRVPVLGSLVQKQALSRMALILSSLLRSGVELVEALSIAEASTGNVLLKRATKLMRADLELGRGLADSMNGHAIFTPSFCQVFVLGQQSGKLDTMLERIGNAYDKQAATLSTRFASVIEPVLIIGLSIVVGFVLIATVLPILEAGNVLAE